MKNIECFATFKKYDTFIQSWLTEDTSDDHVLIVHGLGEHSSCYAHMAQYLTDRGVSCHGFDFIGHGQSSGQRGYVPQFELLVEQLLFVYQTLQNQNKNTKLSIFSHSMGGLVTLKSLLDGSIKESIDLIFSNPLVHIKVEIPQWKLTLAENIAQILPRFSLGNEINELDITKDQNFLEIYKKDPLRHKKISSKLFIELQENTGLVSSQLRHVLNKTLFLISPNDKVCDADASQKLSQQFVNSHIELFPQSGHEIINDLSKSKAFDDIIDFLKGTS